MRVRHAWSLKMSKEYSGVLLSVQKVQPDNAGLLRQWADDQFERCQRCWPVFSKSRDPVECSTNQREVTSTSRIQHYEHDHVITGISPASSMNRWWCWIPSHMSHSKFKARIPDLSAIPITRRLQIFFMTIRSPLRMFANFVRLTCSELGIYDFNSLLN